MLRLASNESSQALLVKISSYQRMESPRGGKNMSFFWFSDTPATMKSGRLRLRTTSQQNTLRATRGITARSSGGRAAP